MRATFTDHLFLPPARRFMGRLVALALTSTSLHAAPPQWYSQLYPSNTNSQITLTDDASNSITAITNPTSASVKTNANINTQPPTIIVQATSGLPFKTIGSACTNGTDTAALSAADHLTLLTCGATNIWTITNRVALQTADAGRPCNSATDGNLAVDASGSTLSCQSGVWRPNGSGIGNTVTTYGLPMGYRAMNFSNFGKHNICFLSGTFGCGGVTNFAIYPDSSMNWWAAGETEGCWNAGLFSPRVICVD
jgi:hypothetical protein